VVESAKGSESFAGGEGKVVKNSRNCTGKKERTRKEERERRAARLQIGRRRAKGWISLGEPEGWTRIGGGGTQ